MTPFRAPVVTLMSWFVVFAPIACATPDQVLPGSTACESMTCGSGTLCKLDYTGVDGGVTPASCVAVAAGCPIADCLGSTCPACVAALCNPDLRDAVRLDGRQLSCLGQ
jgi:hypothetical protein